MSSLIIKNLRKKQSEAMGAYKSILQLCETEDRTPTADEEKQLEGFLTNADSIESQIKKYEELDKREKFLSEKNTSNLGDNIKSNIVIDPTSEHYKAYNGRLTCFLNNDGSGNNEKAYRFGVFLAATVYKIPKYIKKLASWGYDVEQLAMGTNAALVPPEWESEIIKLRDTYGVFRRNARYRPMGAGTRNIPKLTGNLTAYWVDENTAITDSDLAYGTVTLIAKKLAALTRYSKELDEDSMINMGDEIAFEMAYALARAEDLAGFIGDGTATYGGTLGLLTILNDTNHDASLIVAAAGKDTIAELTLDDYVQMIARLPEYAQPFARWYVNTYTHAASMLSISGEAGGNTIQTLTEGVQFSFLGFPVERTAALPGANAAPSSIPVLLGALRFSSSLGERRGFDVERSEERYFELDQIGVKGTERIDIENHNLGTDTEAGPVIGLKLAAAA